MVSTYFLNLVAGNVMHAEATAALPETYYVALSTTIPNEDGSNFTEVTGGAYVRMPYGKCSAPIDGRVCNLDDVEYPECEADWGTVLAFGLYDAVTGGNLLAWNQVSPPQLITLGAQARFKPEALKITFEGLGV